MNKKIVWTGFIGIIAAIVVGYAEAMLHYSSLGFEGVEYNFFLGVESSSLVKGHFTASFFFPLYFIGFYHLFLMIDKVDSTVKRMIVPILFGYGLSVGGVWLGSRIYLAELAKLSIGNKNNVLSTLLENYSVFNETLLTATRFSVLFGSIYLVVLILQNKTRYPKWVALFNPICGVLYSFGIFYFFPAVGKYMMPIAMNIAFFLFFSISTFLTLSHKQES